MPAFIVNINANKLISVKAEWLKNPVLGKETLVFFSPNESENAFFSTDISYFFSPKLRATYKGYVQERFSKFFEFIYVLCEIFLFVFI